MCGIVGIVANGRVNQTLYDALTVLQHRGQDAAGIATCENERLHQRKDNGLVREVFRTKHMLRRVSSRYLPEQVVKLEKQGFRFPLGIWFRTDLKEFLRSLFRQSRFVELGIFEQDYINRILDEHIGGRVDHNYRIWILMNLEIWYRLYFEGETVDSMQDFTARLA